MRPGHPVVRAAPARPAVEETRQPKPMAGQRAGPAAPNLFAALTLPPDGEGLMSQCNKA